ncbi:CBO0543 family protein [Rossellomorea vietnamensis]
MSIVILLLYILAGIKFGEWSEFEKYYPTLLYLIIGDLLAQFLLFNHSLWMFHPMDAVGRFFNLNHTYIALLKMAIQYTVTIAIFIGRLPEGLYSQFLRVLLWTAIYGANEFVTNHFGGLTYHRGWNYGWDIAFNLMMFIMLIIHYKRPLTAWVLTVPIIMTLWMIFDIPLSVLKE